MITIFDLDYTLLDTKRFKEDLAAIFNMPLENFCDDYNKHFKDKGINYSLEKHLEVLRDEKNISDQDEKEIKEKFELLLKNIDKYLFPQAENILKQIKDRGDKLILLSFGDIGWQRQKINNLTIKKYFDEIIFEDKNKAESEYLKSLRDSGEEILIINDNALESVELKRSLGDKSETYLIKGPYSYNIEHKRMVYANISELAARELTQKGEVARQLHVR